MQSGKPYLSILLQRGCNMKPICPFKVGDNVQIMGTDMYGEVVEEDGL